MASPGSIGLGRIFGVDVELHWTFIALILITAVLSLFLSFLFVLLFICVLIHEFAHAIASKKNGIGVKRIILLPLGGATIMDEQNLDPRIEFNVSIVGPIMSIFLGGIFGLLLAFIQPGIINEVVNFLFEINILLGVFNLLPAFPLDGGRVFRSYVQKKSDYYRATMATAQASKVIMSLIVIGTFAIALFTNYSFSYKEFTTLWDLLIVFFLYAGMQSEVNTVVLRKRTEGLRVGDAVTTKFALLRRNERISDLKKYVHRHRISTMLIRLNDGIGLIDLSKQIPESAVYARDMSVKLPSAKAEDSIIDALARMESGGTNVIAVFSGKRFVGITTSSLIQATMNLHMFSAKKRGNDAND
jgi:Zn-dependent protease